MFLTTSASSISALSSVRIPNNNPTTTTTSATTTKKTSPSSSSSLLPTTKARRSTSSTRDNKSIITNSSSKSKPSGKPKQKQSAQSTTSTATNIRRTSGDKKRREQLPRSDSSSSDTSNTSSEATESSTFSTRASSLTSSPPPLDDCRSIASGPADNVAYSPVHSRSSLDANNHSTATIDRQHPLDPATDSISHNCSRNTQPKTATSQSVASLSKSPNNSMRRRAGESVSGSNLIPNSLRAVFRDINGANTLVPGSAANTEETGQTAEQLRNTHRYSGTSQLSQPRNSGSMTRDPVHADSVSSSHQTASKSTAGNVADMPSIKFIPHQDQRSAKPSLGFAPMTRTLPDESSVIRVGRYSERDASPTANHSPSAAPIGFKSKVVSRRHCEFWCVNGQWFVKDVKSSSGTFLNHIRLSQPSTESKPFPINDGDIIQLGMDFRGGEESIFRCVKIRIEVNRGWQKKLNDFNTTTHKALRALAKEAGPTSSTECSICLMSVAPCQALFVAPCSHVWHYKCIRPVINNPKMYPQFLCPNCRAVADLDADIEENVDGWDETEELPGQETELGQAIPNRVGTPINGDLTGNEMALDTQAEDPSIVIQPPSSEVDLLPSAVGDSQIDTNELQDATILFSETVPLELRDPRNVSDTLEGVLTPRNEAGPFVFDGSGRRVQPSQAA